VWAGSCVAGGAVFGTTVTIDDGDDGIVEGSDDVVGGGDVVVGVVVVVVGVVVTVVVNVGNVGNGLNGGSGTTDGIGITGTSGAGASRGGGPCGDQQLFFAAAGFEPASARPRTATSRSGARQRRLPTTQGREQVGRALAGISGGDGDGRQPSGSRSFAESAYSSARLIPASRSRSWESTMDSFSRFNRPPAGITSAASSSAGGTAAQTGRRKSYTRA
jgi:hypothetical protein